MSSLWQVCKFPNCENIIISKCGNKIKRRYKDNKRIIGRSWTQNHFWFRSISSNTGTWSNGSSRDFINNQVRNQYKSRSNIRRINKEIVLFLIRLMVNKIPKRPQSTMKPINYPNFGKKSKNSKLSHQQKYVNLYWITSCHLLFREPKQAARIY